MTRFITIVFLAALFAASCSDGAPEAELQFAPAALACFEVLETPALCDGDSGPGSASDVRSTFCVGWGSDCGQRPTASTVNDSLYSLVVSFLPQAWGVPAPGAVPLGALAGQISSQRTLGLINGSCDSSVQIGFSLMNASVEVTDTISPQPAGDMDPMEPLALDSSPANGIPDGVDKYPIFLKDMFGGAEPRARLFAISRIQRQWNPLNVLIFESDELVTVGDTPLAAPPGSGYAAVTVIGDSWAPPPTGVISDVCAPDLTNLVVLGRTLDNPCSPKPAGPPVGANCPGSVVFATDVGYPLYPCEGPNIADEDRDGVQNDGCPQGPAAEGDVSENSRIAGACAGTDEGGCSFLTNPAAVGDYGFTTYMVSLPDADGDAIDNTLDVCPTEPNPGWNPRLANQASDPDGDGLPSECDPAPDIPVVGGPLLCPWGIVGADEDQDCTANRQDRCPTVEELLDPNLPLDPVTNPPNPVDSDRDSIGDRCDPNSGATDGERLSVCLTYTLVVGAPPEPIIAAKVATPGPECLKLPSPSP